ncbi:MAG: hypothetical protein AB1813_24460 [Verrucomicrobiota bacterium]|jgi:hypothetical protein
MDTLPTTDASKAQKTKARTLAIIGLIASVVIGFNLLGDFTFHVSAATGQM